jgi:hypothetical protein
LTAEKAKVVARFTDSLESMYNKFDTIAALSNLHTDKNQTGARSDPNHFLLQARIPRLWRTTVNFYLRSC